jgi:cytochrome b pre-mRNA-processing protein 3
MIPGLRRWLVSPRMAGDLDTLEGTVMRAARDPVLFTDLGMEDSFDGRFDSLTLHATLLHRRLVAEGGAARRLAQLYADRMFRSLDHALREIGVGDLTVPKRVRKLSEAFHGRAVSLLAALADPDDAALLAHVERNVYSTREVDPATMRAMADRVRALDARLTASSVREVIDGPAWRLPVAELGVPPPPTA